LNNYNLAFELLKIFDEKLDLIFPLLQMFNESIKNRVRNDDFFLRPQNHSIPKYSL